MQRNTLEACFFIVLIKELCLKPKKNPYLPEKFPSRNNYQKTGCKIDKQQIEIWKKYGRKIKIVKKEMNQHKKRKQYSTSFLVEENQNKWQHNENIYCKNNPEKFYRNTGFLS